MDDIEIIVKKSPEECLGIIKKNFPNRYDLFDIPDANRGSQFKLKSIEYIEKQDELLLKITRRWGPAINVKGHMNKINDNETQILLSVKDNIPFTLLFWIVCAVFFLFSLFSLIAFLGAYLAGELSHNEQDISNPIISIAYSILWPICNNKFKKVESKKLIEKLKRVL